MAERSDHFSRIFCVQSDAKMLKMTMLYRPNVVPRGMQREDQNKAVLALVDAVLREVNMTNFVRCASKLLVAGACLVAVAGCKRTPTDNIEHKSSNASLHADPEQTPKIGKDSEMVIRSDELEVTLGDYKMCLKQNELEGVHFSKRALANPRFQRDQAQRCFQVKFMRQYAEKNNVKASNEVHTKALNDFVAKAKVDSASQLAAKLEVTVDELNMLVENAIRPTVLQRYFVGMMSPEKQKEMYKIDFRRFSVDWLTFKNDVSDEAVSEFLKDHEKEFNVEISNNKFKYMNPPQAEVVRYGFKLNGDDLNDGLAYQDANRLKVEAVKNGENAANALCQKLEGCEILNDAFNTYKLLRTEDTRWAFRSPNGTVSDIVKKDDAIEIMILKNVIPPSVPDWSNNEERMKAAKKMLIDLRPDDRLLSELHNALTQPNVDVRSATKGLGGLYRFVENARFMDMGNEDKIPSKIVRDTLQTLSESELMQFSNPLVEEGKIQIFRVRTSETPSDEKFAAQKEEWIEAKSSDPKYGLVQKWLDDSAPNLTTFNIRVLEDTYGVLQPNGKIM